MMRQACENNKLSTIRVLFVYTNVIVFTLSTEQVKRHPRSIEPCLQYKTQLQVANVLFIRALLRDEQP